MACAADTASLRRSERQTAASCTGTEWPHGKGGEEKQCRAAASQFVSHRPLGPGLPEQGGARRKSRRRLQSP
eukprot:4746175-Prorocentrum_lima.AAC.1